MPDKDAPRDKEAIGFAGIDFLISEVTNVADEVETPGPAPAHSSTRPHSQKEDRGATPQFSDHLGTEEDEKRRRASWGLFILIVGGVSLGILVFSNYLKPSTPYHEQRSSKASGQQKTTPKSTSAEITHRDLSRTFHVTARSLNVRKGPGDEREIVGHLSQWDSVKVIRFEGNWACINLGTGLGWVSKKYLAEGDGQSAILRYCRERAGTTLVSGEVLVRDGPRGLGELKVSNQTQNDALVRLKQNFGSSSYVFYVPQMRVATLDGIAVGSFQVQVMYGSNYSRACGTFLDNPNVEVFNSMANFEEIAQNNGTQYNSYEITLHVVQGGTATTEKVDPSVFFK